MKKSATEALNHHYKTTALVLQGGGALGSYQAGAFESMAKAGLEPNWFAGISIGSINAAILAGNTPDKRVEKLKSFWDAITVEIANPWLPLLGNGSLAERYYVAQSSLSSLWQGVPDFFTPRGMPPFLAPAGSEAAISFYDTSALEETLREHVDFDLINRGEVRLSVGAVNIHTGNFTYFDNTERTIGPEHIMASGALPPGFPPVEIDGEYYWDGGLVSNTPLAYVMEHSDGDTTLIFQVDLFSAVGPYPESIDAVEERRKDIVYSSRTRMNTTAFREQHELRMAIAHLAKALPPEAHKDPTIRHAIKLGHEQKITIVHLIYRRHVYDGPFKDYEFSRKTMLEHWKAGAADARRTLRATEWRTPPSREDGISVYDITRPGT